MPDIIATPTRELAYLGAAAGNNDAPANPARLEEQLYAKMAARISALEQSGGGGGGGRVIFFKVAGAGTPGADNTISFPTDLLVTDLLSTRNVATPALAYFLAPAVSLADEPLYYSYRNGMYFSAIEANEMVGQSDTNWSINFEAAGDYVTVVYSANS